ncbi:ketopantoate reductase family protein [Leucobacter sp. M11]|uniref:ketopantoate reductase family protein n=1 Tax=Leucobacter sp. M11 TaxID=2993565 RepID=UPI002D7EF3CB|nr:2-dehydropantoate 2-reductase [Leucobacter sp. M11]MEB4614947.1 2-dehydropantoate 2-reductase [Leucobacter sp. M11]
MRIAVIGAGAMGQLFGTKLVNGGHDVVMVDASPAVLAAIDQTGMTLREGGSSTTVSCATSLATELTGTVDGVLLLTKTLHSAAAIASVRHVLTEQTVGISVQNGLGNEEPLLPHFGVERTLIGMTDYPADRESDGTISTESSGSVRLGGLVPAAADRARLWASLFAGAGLDTAFEADVMVSIWEKVIFNAALNTISAATGLTLGQIATHPSGLGLVDSVLAEALAVARAEGVHTNEARVRSAVTAALQHHGDHRTSMLVDLEAGRGTEIDSIAGALVDHATQRSVATPVLSALSDVVRLRTKPEPAHATAAGNGERPARFPGRAARALG